MAYRDGDQAVIGRIIDDDWSAVAAVPSIIPAPVADLGDARPRSRTDTASLPRCPEIDCVRHLLPPLVIDVAELRAAKVGVGADRVLIASGAISEETYVAALAASLGMAFEPLPTGRRAELLGALDGLRDDALETREKAADALRAFGTPAIPLFLDELDDPDVEYRERIRRLIVDALSLPG